METKLSRKDITKLIHLYRSHPVLWDKNYQFFKHKDLNNKAYHDISNKMGMPVDFVKKMIRSLRITYNGEKKRIKMKTSCLTNTLWWFNDMLFLDSYAIDEKATENSTEDSLNSQNVDDCVETPKEQEEKTSKFDQALEKLIRDNEQKNEYTTFGESIGHQLQNLPAEDGYALMSEIQNLITQRKLRKIYQQKAHPFDLDTDDVDIRNVLIKTDIDFDSKLE